MSSFLYLLTMILIPWLVAWTISGPGQSRGIWWPFDMKDPAPPAGTEAGGERDGTAPNGRLGPRTWGRPGQARSRAAPVRAPGDAADPVMPDPLPVGAGTPSGRPARGEGTPRDGIPRVARR